MTTRRLMTYAPLILLALTLAILYFPVLRGEIFYWGLPTLQFYPWRHLAVELLRDGILPLWNPYNGAGAPLLANYQSALLYPPSWFSFVLPLEWTMSLTAVVHLWIAGWGMWRLTGRLGVSPLGRGVSMFAFALTNYLVARLFTFPIIEAAAWLPWIAWAALGVISTGQRRQVAWLAVFTALQLLAGHAQTTWYSLTLVGALSVWWTLFPPHPQPLSPLAWERGETPSLRFPVGTRHASSSLVTMTDDAGDNGRDLSRPYGMRLLRLFAVLLAMALGAGISALQLAPTAELLMQSQRGEGVDYYVAMNFSYAPLRTLNFLSPLIFGTPADGTYFTQGAYFEDAVYIGLIPLIGAFAAVTAWLRRRGRAEAVFWSVPFWLLVVIVGFVFALGQFTPIFPFLYNHVPTFAMFQAPVRWHLWTVFGLSVLAGIGVSAWGRGLATRRWARRLLVASAGMLGVLIFLLVTNMGGQTVFVLIRALIGIAAFLIAAAILTLTQPNGESPRYGRWMIAVLVVIAVDLGIASWGLNPTTTQAAFANMMTTPAGRADIRYGRGYWLKEHEEQFRYGCIFRFADYRFSLRLGCGAWLSGDLPNSNVFAQTALLNNFDPLVSAHYTRYVQLIERVPDSEALLPAAGVGWVSALTQSNRTVGAGMRVRTVGHANVCWHETEADLEAALVDPAWNPYIQIHMLGNAGCPPLSEYIPTELRMTDRVNTVTISLNATQSAWFYLADTDYPGWKAYVDDQPVPIYRANLMFRAVQVDAGLREVSFRYEPDWIAPAALITVVSLVVLLFLFRLRD